jgi:hypothetical protein
MSDLRHRPVMMMMLLLLLLLLLLLERWRQRRFQR